MSFFLKQDSKKSHVHPLKMFVLMILIVCLVFLFLFYFGCEKVNEVETLVFIEGGDIPELSIMPFRRLIIYPVFMEAVKNIWEEFNR